MVSFLINYQRSVDLMPLGGIARIGQECLVRACEGSRRDHIIPRLVPRMQEYSEQALEEQL